jgi:myo-inositol 2-dehydrogenase / D-chiro-inositol 1-dehydrogenase
MHDEGLFQGNLSRRGFLQGSLATLMGAGLPAWFAQELIAAEEEKRAKEKPVAANDRLVLGVIGVGSPQSRGSHIMGLARRHKGIEVVAVCDVDSRHRERAAMLAGGKDVQKFEDFRQLLDRKDINAVIVATPDHWHTLVATDALRKGKDVYCEKPLTLTVAEGKALVKVAEQTNRVFQVGSQQRSEFGGRFRLACELVRNGRIGKLKTIETRIGSNPTSPTIPAVEPPKELNWDFWLGATPRVPYRYLKQGGRVFTNCHYEFRWWYQWSGGKMTDWGAHHNDIAQWALAADNTGPVAVEAVERTPPSSEAGHYTCHPNFKVVFTYANGVKVICTSGGENGVKLNGEDGKWIFVSRGKLTASDDKLIKEPLPKDAQRLYPSNDHMGNFLDCVRSRKPTICPARVGHRSATVCHLGNIGVRLGKRLQWDPAREMFVDNAAANKMLSREMRAPWKLDV